MPLIVSSFPSINELLGLNLALVPFVLGGGYMIWSTDKAVLETGKGKVSVGVLVY